MDSLKLFFILSDVENKWKQNQYVNWLTGEETLEENKLDSFSTHCSAFVSSICYKLNIPMLSPPHVGTEGLANKQYEWMCEIGTKHGWKEINKNVAQKTANKGIIVFIGYYHPDDNTKGHVAFVSPNKDLNKIKICQAGLINSSCTDIENGFSNHKMCRFWKYDNSRI